VEETAPTPTEKLQLVCQYHTHTITKTSDARKPSSDALRILHRRWSVGLDLRKTL
jgi:hypothetical protein